MKLTIEQVYNCAPDYRLLARALNVEYAGTYVEILTNMIENLRTASRYDMTRLRKFCVQQLNIPESEIGTDMELTTLMLMTMHDTRQQMIFASASNWLSKVE